MFVGKYIINIYMWINYVYDVVNRFNEIVLVICFINYVVLFVFFEFEKMVLVGKLFFIVFWKY